MLRSFKSRLRKHQPRDGPTLTSNADEQHGHDFDKKKYYNKEKFPLIREAAVSILMSMRQSLFCCCGIWITVIIIAALVVSYGHHVICVFNKAFCTPLSEYIYRFPMLPVPRESILNHPSDFLSTPNNCARFEKYMKLCPKGKQLLFLFGESRGGSTYVYDSLDFSESIMMRGKEPLYHFSNEICNNNPMLRNAEKCTFDNWLNALYENSMYKHKGFFEDSKNKAKILGTKINIEQIPTEFYRDLGAFLHCTKETSIVLQVTRAASIASFLNYQAEVPERIRSIDLHFGGDKVPAPLGEPLKLDPHLAADWVQQRDSLSREIFQRLAFGLSIKFTHFYYEQLHGEFAEMHWSSLFAFLGVVPISIAEERSRRVHTMKGIRTREKTHGSIRCADRISNWKEVKEALNGTLSALVCETAS
ncbi:unnamed protein product [Cylindrotheca closterium]|uniref:Sulfotransferase n=1 Tax=Cylindrotheca closterium TaxID=2856 RepID=A0AAD2JKV9_9STRA|nr:unnamed protein product [Cylindrotheca closterium]